MAGFRTSDPVVVLGHGVGHVTVADDGALTICLADGDVVVRAADVDALLRPIVGRDDAQRLLSRLCERCTEPRALPRLRSIRELARGALDRQVEYVRWYFRSRNALDATELDIVLVVSERVLAELAIALGVDAGDLRAAVKRGVSLVQARATRPLPPAPALQHCEHLRSFWLDRIAVVGERPEASKDVLRVAVRPGAWHAYAVNASTLKREGILVRHAELPADAPLDSPKKLLGSVNVEGGMIGLLDAAALADPAFGIDEVERLRRDGDEYGDRGTASATLGDGEHRVWGDEETAATAIFLSFGGEAFDAKSGSARKTTRLAKGPRAPTAAKAPNAEGPAKLRSLERAATAPSEARRVAAVRSLAAHGGDEAGEVVMRCLDDDSDVVRGEAARALARLGHRAALPKLIEKLTTLPRWSNARWWICEALGTLGDARAVDPLLRVVADRADTDAHAFAAAALGKLGDARAVEALSPLLDSRDADVRKAAQDAIAALTGHHEGGKG